MTAAMENEHLRTLQKSIISTKSLLESFDTLLKHSPAAKPATITTSPDPLAVLSDASSLLKAQTTKLSLLILNKPFTPSAITQILTSLSTSCLPALASTLELCPPATHSVLLHQHIRTNLSRGFRALSALLATIPQDVSGQEQHRERDTLAATGLLWETCDSMAKLASTGLPALAAEELEKYHSLLKDAIAELEGWDPNNDTETDSNPDSDYHTTTSSSSSNTSPSRIPYFLTLTLRLLRHVRLLYPALKKRRIRSFPLLAPDSDHTSTSLPFTSQIQSLDALLTSLSSFSSEADEIAGALYAGDEKVVLRQLTSLREHAEVCIQDVMKDWQGAEDEFSTWTRKWLEMARAMNLSGEQVPVKVKSLDITSPSLTPQHGSSNSGCSNSISLALKSELPIR